MTGQPQRSYLSVEDARDRNKALTKESGPINSLGKTLFISGASRGIGLAIALRAAKEKACIAIAAKTATPHPTV